MHLDNHPNCCGIFILSGFYEPQDKAKVKHVEYSQDSNYWRYAMKPSELTNEQNFDKIMKAYEGYFNEASHTTKRMEAVLTDNQLESYDGFWAKKLKDNGFQLSCRFRNTSGSVCNVFHKYSASGTVEGPVPNWEVEENASN